MIMQRIGWVSLSLLMTAGLCACGGSDPEEPLACIDPTDPRANDPALRNRLGICPDIGSSVSTTAAREPVAGNCPAADVGAWQVSIRYNGELGATSTDRRRVVEHQVTAELNALLTMQRRNNASGENWSPAGRVSHQMREYVDGELTLQVVGEGAPIAGNSAILSDSRILLSIDASDCTYNLYSAGTVPSQITRDGETTSGAAGYGAVIIRKQPAMLTISESRSVPVLETSFDPQVEMPDLYIPGIGTQEGDGVLVSWQIAPVEE